MIVGIDPGVTGALAFYDNDRTLSTGWLVYDMPVVGNILDASALQYWLLNHKPEHCYLEFVTSHPHDGRMGAFRLGGMFFAIRAVLSCCKIPYELVTPAKWKKYYHLGKDKEKSRLKALELFPKASAMLARKSDHNRAEAMLIAYYGAKNVRLV